MRENGSVDSDREMLLDERAAARFLGICPRKLWGLANKGVVPFIRIGVKSKRYSQKDLEDFIAASRQRSPEPAGAQQDDVV
jgi:hypothetical protein